VGRPILAAAGFQPALEFGHLGGKNVLAFVIFLVFHLCR